MTSHSGDVAIPVEDVDRENDAHSESKLSLNDQVKKDEKHDALEATVFIEKPEENVVIYPHGCCSRHVERIEQAVHNFFHRYRRQIVLTLKILLVLAYIAYFIYCVQYKYFNEGAYILTGVTAIFLLKFLYGRFKGSRLSSALTKYLFSCGKSAKAKSTNKLVRYGLYVLALILFVVDLAISAHSFDIHTVKALLGIFCLIVLCFVFSASPSRVNWHPVYWGFMIQFLFATITLRTEIGYNIFKWVGDLINGLVHLSDKGSEFVFGHMFVDDDAGFFLDCAGVIVFFNALIFLLEYFGILEFIVLKIGGALALCLETGPVESVVAGANIFIGLSEAPLLVRPYLHAVTKSELHAIMVCGFSSISGAFMAMFIKAGAPPSHLLTAAVISAPAALAITKLMYPEKEAVDFESQRNIKMKDEAAKRNALQAFADGASFSIKLVATIMVNMIAFVSLLNLVDVILTFIGDRAGIKHMTFEFLCSYALYPIAFLMGVPAQDCRKLGSLIGIKLIATPFVAYVDLGRIIQNREIFDEYLALTNGTWHYSGEDIILDQTNTTLISGIMTPRGEVVSTYALCGISAFPAIGFSMGTLIPMCPERKPDVVKLIIRAYIAGNLVNIVTGAVAGVMYTGA